MENDRFEPEEDTQTNITALPYESRSASWLRFLKGRSPFSLEQIALIFLVATMALFGTFLFNEWQTPTYSAHSTLEIKEEAQDLTDEGLQHHSQELISAKIIKKLTDDPDFKIVMELDQKYYPNLESPANRLQKNLKTSLDNKKIKLNYTDPNPHFAMLAANHLPLLYEKELAETQNKILQPVPQTLASQSSQNEETQKWEAREQQLKNEIAKLQKDINFNETHVLNLKNHIKQQKLSLPAGAQDPVLTNILLTISDKIKARDIFGASKDPSNIEKAKSLDRDLGFLKSHFFKAISLKMRPHQSQVSQLSQSKQTLQKELDEILIKKTELENNTSQTDHFDLSLLENENQSPKITLTVLESASLPNKNPYAFRSRNLGIAVLGGFFLGILLATFLPFSLKKVCDVTTLENATGIPVLGILPKTPTKQSAT